MTLHFLNINENLSNFIAKSAENLCCSYFLIFHCVVLVLAILASKHTSQYRSALNIPTAEEFSVNWGSIRKKSFGTRFGVNLRYFIHKVRNIANSEMSTCIFLQRPFAVWFTKLLKIGQTFL